MGAGHSGSPQRASHRAQQSVGTSSGITLTLPQATPMSQLPERGDCVGLDDPQREVVVLAIDTESSIWTVLDTVTGELLLLTFDAECNWQQLTPHEDVA